MTATIEAPGTRGRSRGRVNWEKWGWIYMRVSGVVLVVLVFGHLFVNLLAGDGVSAIDFAFVAGKWADPFYVVWDTALLWLALIHGANGMRTIVNDYVTRPTVRRALQGFLFASTAILLILGTLVIYTFDPCPTIDPVTGGSAAANLPSFCTAVAG